MALACLQLPHEIAPGPLNMALDEALLELVAERGDHAILRTYGWSEPTLSLGYFQRVADAELEPRWRSVPLVRRATGGGALWHHHEVTYALVVPSKHPFWRQNTALYRAVHEAILGLLRECGADAHRRGDNEVESPGTSNRPFLCFVDRDQEDLVVGGSKIVGSAQRRRAGAILQHGSLLLRRSATSPELAGLSDLAHLSDDQGYWSGRLMDAIPATLGVVASTWEIPSKSRRRAAELAEEIYKDPGWTRRR